MSTEINGHAADATMESSSNRPFQADQTGPTGQAGPGAVPQNAAEPSSQASPVSQAGQVGDSEPDGAYVAPGHAAHSDNPGAAGSADAVEKNGGNEDLRGGERPGSSVIPAASPDNQARQEPQAPRQLPPLSAPGLAEPTFLSRLFDVLAYAPLLTLSIIYIAQAFFLVDTRELWYSDEVRHADVLKHMLEARDWFVLNMNGEFYPDKPPLYFWFLSGLYHFILFFDAEISPAVFNSLGLKIKLAHEGRLIQQVMSLGAVVSGLLFIWASYAFARITVRFDKRLSLAAGLVLLGSLYLLAGTHYARMDLLFAAFIVLSQIFFFAAVQRQRSMPLMLAAFFFMALACLCKGPMGALFPLSTAVLYLLWQGRIRRILSLDFLAGLLLVLVMVGAWGVVLVERYDWNYVYSVIVDRQIIQRALDAWHHSRSWYDYLWMLPLIWMPFVFVLPFAPWSRVLNPVKVFRTLREPRCQGLCYAWVFFLSGFIALSLVSTKIHIYLLPLFAPLAVFTAQVIMSLPESRSRYFKIILATFVTVLIPVFAAPLVLPMFFDTSIRILGTVVAAGIALVFSALFWGGINGRRPEGLLLTWVLFCCVLMQPLGLVTAPSLDAVLSPKAQAETIRKYSGEGYYPLSYGIYPGIYSFYVGGKVNEISDKSKLEELLRSHDKLIMAIRLKDWEKLDLQSRPELAEVSRQRLAEQEAVLLVRKGPELEPAHLPARLPEPEQVSEPAQAPVREPGHEPGHEPAPEPAPEPVGAPQAAPEPVREPVQEPGHNKATPESAAPGAAAPGDEGKSDTGVPEVKSGVGNATQPAPASGGQSNSTNPAPPAAKPVLPENMPDLPHALPGGQGTEMLTDLPQEDAPAVSSHLNEPGGGSGAASDPKAAPQTKAPSPAPHPDPSRTPSTSPAPPTPPMPSAPLVPSESGKTPAPASEPKHEPGILDKPDLPIREAPPDKAGNIAVSS